MPTYDYECQDCGHTFEEFQAMSAEALKVCPKCKKPSLLRLIGAGAGIIFKGSGFYETDYKRKDQPKPSSDSSSTASSPSSSSSESSSSSPSTPSSTPAGSGGGGDPKSAKAS